MQRSLTDGATSEAVARFEKLVRNISEDLSVVRDRVQSATVKAAREKAEASLRGWSGAGLKILKPVPGGLTEIPTTFSLTQQGDEAVAALDDLVELVAAYGFDYRTEAEASVAAARTAMLGIADRYRTRRIHHRNGLCLFAQQADLGCGARRRARGGRQFRR